MTRTYLTDFDLKDLRGQYDVAIIGSGIAGLYSALMLDKSLKVLVVSKSSITESNSYLAQGGIAASMSEEEALSHIEDTISAGCNHNNIDAVREMIRDSKENIDVLIDLEVPFDRSHDGSIHMTKEGGHSTSRILHVLDKTGEGIVETLVYHAQKRNNITILEDSYAVDVITFESEKSNERIACGLTVLSKEGFFTVKSKAVIIASGGIGKLYDKSTNAINATGDGIGIGKRAGANFGDMEFVQFHPTGFIPKDCDVGPLLISEAVRGEGGRLVNSDNEYFMDNIHPLKDLAPRNIVSEAIFDQLDKGKEVFLDLSAIESEYVRSRFPNIYDKMKGYGYDLTKDYIPVSPVQHYFMGGIRVDIDARTNIKALYSCGEASNTGVHGANRLASNSLLEAIVYGRRAAHHISENIEDLGALEPNMEKDFSYVNEGVYMEDKTAVEIIDNVKSIMSASASIIRDTKRLDEALLSISKIMKHIKAYKANSPIACEAINMATCAELILEAAHGRKDTLGTHILRSS